MLYIIYLTEWLFLLLGTWFICHPCSMQTNNAAALSHCVGSVHFYILVSGYKSSALTLVLFFGGGGCIVEFRPLQMCQDTLYVTVKIYQSSCPQTTSYFWLLFEETRIASGLPPVRNVPKSLSRSHFQLTQCESSSTIDGEVLLALLW